MSDESTKNSDQPDGIRDEYDFDYSKSRTNRFAAEFTQGSVAVILDPDVAAVFSSAESVNTFLRSVISALPEKKSSAK
ncbi:MAG: hypothetical protein ABI718_16705 [Acidobacteriota bacterium]